MTELAKVRLDRWLWAARFFKTRAQAKSAIEGGKVDFLLVTGGSRRSQKPKVSKEVARGDMLCIRRGWTSETVVIMDLCEQRGNATRAQALYTETSESM